MIAPALSVRSRHTEQAADVLHTVDSPTSPATLSNTEGDMWESPATAASSSKTGETTPTESKERLLRQQTTFNCLIEERSELEREGEALDALLIAQIKHSNDLVKEWIRMV